MPVDVFDRNPAMELEQFHIARPAPSSMPSILGTRLMDLLLRNIPLKLVPDLKQGPKPGGF